MTIWQPDIQAETGPRYIAIANAIEVDVKAGKLSPGARLPTHRDLADMLGVTVGTVTRGYGEAARRGLLRGETGRGTFIGGETASPVMFHREEVLSGVVDMRMTLPLYGQNPDLCEALRRIATDPNTQRLLEYYPSCGRLVDRQAGVKWIRKYHLDVLPENVAVTTGGQNALAVVVSAMFRPGDTIAVEGITYPFIKTLTRRFDVKLIPIEQDENGIIPEALDRACREQPVQGVYLMPTCQNPTSSRLPEYRRQEIASIARRRDCFIIEDDAYAQVAGNLGIPLAALAPERTFFIASMSKAVAGGLRVAYLASPQVHAKTVERALSDMVWMAPPLMAEVARQWILDGTTDQIIKAKREEARHRITLTKKALSGLDISLQKTGYYAWLKLPEPWTSGDFVRVAEENNLLITTDETFVVGRIPLPHAVRLSLSGAADHATLSRGLEVIRTILAKNCLESD